MRLHRLLIPALAVLAACSEPGGAARAQTGSFPAEEAARQVPASAGQTQLSFAPVVRRAAPAVVNVLTAQNRERNAYYEMFGQQQSREVRPTGSGVIVRADGYIVTNNHVVENASEVRVSLTDRREFPARVLLRDARADLAVLKIEVGAERLPTLRVDAAEQPQIGDLVLAMGNPFGVGQTVTSGIVSATERSGGGPATGEGLARIASFIQTDAAINPGNSGGALVDMDGDLIGINTAILSRSGTSSGVGFAVPASLVRQVLDTATGGGSRVVRPFLGVGTAAVTSEIAASLGLGRPEGVLIGEVEPGGPGARGGLREGDLVTAVNGVSVNDPAALNFQIATGRAGETVPLTVRREGRLQTLRVRLETRPEIVREQRTLTGRHPLDGATVANLSPDVVQQFGADPDEVDFTGVVVTATGDGYAGRGAGFRRGDVVQRVNNRSIRTVGDLQAALNGGAPWRVDVRRSGRTVSATFGA